ncbi:MAG: hypothetical protein K8R21_04500, partial [Leptospira sp.]|nr:hypothetical protein [Leptospira sp.]
MIFIIILFSLLSPVYSESVSEHWSKIQKETNSSDWISAEKYLQKAIGEYPDEKDFYGSYSWVLRNLKKPEMALEISRKAFIRWPEDKGVKDSFSYSIIATLDAEYQKAGYKRENFSFDPLPPAEEAFKLSQNEWSSLWYGIALRLNQRFEKSIEHFEKAEQEYKKNKQFGDQLNFAYLEYSEKQRQSGNFASAEVLIKKTLKRDPLNKWGRTSLGNLYNEKIRRLLASGNQTEATGLKSEIETYYVNSFRENIPFYQAIIRLTDYTEDFEPLADYFKSQLKKFPKEDQLYIFIGSTLNKLQHRMKREKAINSEKTKEEANQFLRTGMEIFEKNNPGRPRLSGVSLPLHGKFIVASEFDGGGTHSGYEKYCYDFVPVNEKGKPLIEGKENGGNESYFGFGVPVHAIADGIVRESSDGALDG